MPQEHIYIGKINVSFLHAFDTFLSKQSLCSKGLHYYQQTLSDSTECGFNETIVRRVLPQTKITFSCIKKSSADLTRTEN